MIVCQVLTVCANAILLMKKTSACEWLASAYRLSGIMWSRLVYRPTPENEATLPPTITL